MRTVNVPVSYQSLAGAWPRIPRQMGEGAITQPSLDSQAVAKLRSDVQDAILALENSTDDAGVYAGLLSPNSLRADPTAYEAIPDIADSFTTDELRTIVYDDAKALNDIAQRIWTGAAGHYITGDQAKALQQISAKATGIMSAIKGTGTLTAVSNLDLEQQHQEDMTWKASDLMKQIEMDVVTAEAGSVPVLEPYEKTSTTMKLVVGTGIAAVVIFGLWSLLS